VLFADREFSVAVTQLHAVFTAGPHYSHGLHAISISLQCAVTGGVPNLTLTCSRKTTQVS